MIRVVNVKHLVKIIIVAGVNVFGVATGCGGRAPIEPGYGQGGGGTGGTAGTAGSGADPSSGDTLCAGLDETACAATRGCTVLSCPDCKGEQTFAGCAAPGSASVGCGPCPPLRSKCHGLDDASCTARPDCQRLACPDCSGTEVFGGCTEPMGPGVQCGLCAASIGDCEGLDESSCPARSDCGLFYCPSCTGGENFAGCASRGTAAKNLCMGICSWPPPCSAVMTLASCDARTDCHSVFVDVGTADCAIPGCNTQFSRCADGGTSACKGPLSGGRVLCMFAPPVCEAPTFVVSYTATCYEGCVRPTDCGP
jgi:hypothetical protein